MPGSYRAARASASSIPPSSPIDLDGPAAAVPGAAENGKANKPDHHVGKVVELSDAEAAKVVHRCISTGKVPPKKDRDRLDGFWSELIHLIVDAVTRGETAEKGLAEGLAWVKSRDPARHEAIVAAIDAAPEPTGPDRPKPPPTIFTDRPGGPRPLTDMGNAERLVARHGTVIRYVHSWKKFLHFDGKRWSIDKSGAVTRMAKLTVRDIYREAAEAPTAAEAAACGEWAQMSESKSRLEAMICLAASEKGVPVQPEDLDRDPWLFNVQNGTIELRTGQLRPHRQTDYLTALSPVEYDPTALCPYWDSTLHLVFRKDANLIRYFRQLCGCVLTGTVIEQVLPIFWGVGENGKSTILNMLLYMFGKDYAMKAPPDFLMVKRHETHPTERAGLFGKRLVVAIETGEGARINEVLVKELTGSDPITARRMREDFWTFDPTHKVLLCTNHKPVIKGTDHAIWRRLHLIPFEVKIPPERKDKNMPAKLAAEASGILAWCVRGCLEWQEKGLEPPDAVTNATVKYRKEQDILSVFIEEHCVLLGQARARASALYQAYKTWAERSGERFVTQTEFSTRLTERGFEKKANNGIWYLGIGLRDTGENNSF